MPVLYANRAFSTLAVGITNSATSMSVAAGHGARFPAISGSGYFYVTLDDSAGNVEIVKVTARSTDAFTIVRAQDGTTAQAFLAGAIVELRLVRAMLDDIKAELAPLDGTGASGTWAISVTGSSASTTGNAATATALQTSRTIALSGAATGTATSFNGSANITIPVTGLDASSLNAGTVPDARLTGTYSGITLQTNGGNTHVTTPNSGSPSTNDRTVFGLAQFKSDSSAAVGAIVFSASTTDSNIMHRMKIEGMLYTSGPTVCAIIQGYRSTGSWTNVSKINLGITELSVRWGVDPSGKNCVILGDVGTSWSYPMMAITHAMFSHSGVTDAYCKDWTVALVTSLTGYTNLTGYLTSSVIQATTTYAQGLLSSRTINGTFFNGSANIVTSYWGTTRTLTIGSTGKSVNGSANVSWSLSEIGALADVTPGTAGNVLTSNGSAWVSQAPAAGGQYLGTAATKAIAYNSNTIAENITITSGLNGLSAGPITINNGYTVTVESGAVWAIV